MMNVEQTIISQYGNSSTIGALIQGMNTNIDPTQDIDNFYNVVFNVDTAEGFGLDIWGRIVGNITRTYLVDQSDDTAFRSLILLKALSNITYPSAPAINQLLQNWLGAGSRAYVLDLGQMQMGYVFEFELQPYQLQIIQNSGIFLRPAGVLSNVTASDFPVFGFAEMGTAWAWPFDQAVFITPGVS